MKTKSKSQRRKSEAGFSLTEVMVAVFIMGLLATVVIMNTGAFVGEGRATRAKADVMTYANAIEDFNRRFGRYPTAQEGLESLKTPPSGVDAASYPAGGFIRKIENDPWGNPYQYRFPAQQNAYGFDVFSLGSDGQEGGEGDAADIGNWN